jgi:nitronate monooxygenase
MNFGTGSAAMSSAKAWKDIWGCGQGCGEVQQIQTTAERVAQWQGEYAAAKKRLLGA